MQFGGLLASLIILVFVGSGQAWEYAISTGPGQRVSRGAEEEQRLEPCDKCDPSKCVKPQMCKAGLVLDRCQCCLVCGLEESQLCNLEHEREQLNVYRGRCGRGLECRERKDVDRKQSICHCMSPELVCGSDGKTYSMCQLEAEQTVSKHLAKVGRGMCKTKPTVEMDDLNGLIRQNENLTLICQARGYPNAEVTWYLSKPGDDGKMRRMPGDSQDVTVSVRGGSEKSHVTSYLQITNFKLEYEGTYICSAENALGTSKASKSLVLSA